MECRSAAQPYISVSATHRKALVSKDFLREKFGTLNRPLMDEAHVITRYKEALANGGKARNVLYPERLIARNATKRLPKRNSCSPGLVNCYRIIQKKNWIRW
ncbi:hypothetical protein QW060_26570 [Myroides ceti]|uniref:Uncharacterized protein n=1 Tax=Paenimyroides ceti TaxID=395087 RepID=A0ABT8D0K2_9FLAO|nr:hypothetical protein [Paenimyroides ceti]MDN3710388.1 hypothetical protein [Paenimyroides ceti]